MCGIKEADKPWLYNRLEGFLNLPFLSAQVVLEVQDDGKLNTSDDPPVVFGCLDSDFIHKVFLDNLPDFIH